MVLAKAVDAGVPDVAARAAVDLAALRDADWPVPAAIDAFVEVLRCPALPAADDAADAGPTRSCSRRGSGRRTDRPYLATALYA